MMTDLEITKLCAEAMGYVYLIKNTPDTSGVAKVRADVDGNAVDYDPLHDDAQAMALVNRFEPCIQPPELDGSGRWHVWSLIDKRASRDQDLNRAICECVAKMQSAKVR